MERRILKPQLVIVYELRDIFKEIINLPERDKYLLEIYVVLFTVCIVQ